MPSAVLTKPITTNRPTTDPPQDRLAAHAGQLRNRNLAVDAFRVAAMCLVAVGHWLAADVHVDAAGKLAGGNALDQLPSSHILTWFFQVMPLFFLVGGYSNAASLRSATARSQSAGQWIQTRLLRLLGPASMFCMVWIGLAGAAAVLFSPDLVTRASRVAVIPLWFMAVYVVDIAMAPMIHRLVGRLRGAVLVVPMIAIAVDLAVRADLVGHPLVTAVQVVFGWTCFQALGMAWHEGYIPRRIARVIAPVGLLAAIAGVAFGPWPISLVTVPGAVGGNTFPPSAVLVAFGLAQCALAILVAPALNALLHRNRTMLLVVGGAGSKAMTVYLWHLTALAIVGSVGASLGLIGAPAVGSMQWWVAKVAMMGAAVVVLAGLVWLFGRAETAAPRTPVAMPVAVTALTVAVIAFCFEQVTLHGLTTTWGVIAMTVIAASPYLLARSQKIPFLEVSQTI
jgi:Acyltransferase family